MTKIFTILLASLVVLSGLTLRAWGEIDSTDIMATMVDHYGDQYEDIAAACGGDDAGTCESVVNNHVNEGDIASADLLITLYEVTGQETINYVEENDAGVVKLVEAMVAEGVPLPELDESHLTAVYHDETQQALEDSEVKEELSQTIIKELTAADDLQLAGATIKKIESEDSVTVVIGDQTFNVTTANLEQSATQITSALTEVLVEQAAPVVDEVADVSALGTQMAATTHQLAPGMLEGFGFTSDEARGYAQQLVGELRGNHEKWFEENRRKMSEFAQNMAGLAFEQGFVPPNMMAPSMTMMDDSVFNMDREKMVEMQQAMLSFNQQLEAAADDPTRQQYLLEQKVRADASFFGGEVPDEIPQEWLNNVREAAKMAKEHGGDFAGGMPTPYPAPYPIPAPGYLGPPMTYPVSDVFTDDMYKAAGGTGDRAEMEQQYADWRTGGQMPSLPPGEHPPFEGMPTGMDFGAPEHGFGGGFDFGKYTEAGGNYFSDWFGPADGTEGMPMPHDMPHGMTGGGAMTPGQWPSGAWTGSNFTGPTGGMVPGMMPAGMMPPSGMFAPAGDMGSFTPEHFFMPPEGGYVSPTGDSYMPSGYVPSGDIYIIDGGGTGTHTDSGTHSMPPPPASLWEIFKWYRSMGY